MKSIALLLLFTIAHSLPAPARLPWLELYPATSYKGVYAAKNLVDTASDNGAKTLITFLNKVPDLLKKLKDDKASLTLFAPTDAAFKALDPAITKMLTNDVEYLRKVLSFHVAAKKVTSKDIKDNLLVSSIDAGPEIRFNIYSVPGDYDVADKNVITVDGKTINKPDLAASNGVVHLLNQVIFPIPDKSCLSRLSAISNYSMFVDLVYQAGVDDIFSNPGGYTFLAPNDEGITAAQYKELQSLKKNDLAKIMLRHVIQRPLYNEGLVDSRIVTTLSKESLRILKPPGSSVYFKLQPNMMVQVLLPDLSVSNGVIHGLNSILYPSKKVQSYRGPDIGYPMDMTF